MLQILLTLLALAASPPPGADAPASFEAEPQIATGRFLTATEVRPILEATQANWVALREYDGQDLVYVTHLWAWRCGLHEIRIAVNGGASEVWPMPPCHLDSAVPNAVLAEDGLPYRAFPSGSVMRLDVELLYDDMTSTRVGFDRSAILMP